MFGRTFTLRPLRCFSSVLRSTAPRRLYTTAMSDISVQLTAPNGRTYTQPIGLFINNEFVPSKSGEKITSINPS